MRRATFVLLILAVMTVKPDSASAQSTQQESVHPLVSTPQNVDEEPRRSLEEIKERAATFMANVQEVQKKIDQQQTDSKLGDRVQMAFMTGVVHDVEITSAIEIPPPLKKKELAPEGSIFVIINLTLKNISRCTQTADMSGTVLVDEEGRSYGIRNKANDLMTFINTSPSWILTTAIAQPEVPVNTRIAFVIPEESANGPLSLTLHGPYKSMVTVKLQKRDTEDLTAESKRPPANWPLDMAPWLETRPTRIEVGLNEPTDIGDNRYTINMIDFQENIGRKRGTATPESIFLSIDCTIDNLTNEHQKKFKPRLNLVDGQGNKYYQLTSFGTRRLEISPKGNATARLYFLIPRSAQKNSLDLEIVNRVSFNQSHTGWVRLITSPAF